MGLMIKSTSFVSGTVQVPASTVVFMHHSSICNSLLYASKTFSMLLFLYRLGHINCLRTATALSLFEHFLNTA